MSGPALRPARAADLDALVALEDACFDTHRIARPTFARMLLHATRPVIVLDDGAGGIAGYASVLARRGFAEARLFSIAVAPQRRANGTGRALLAAAESAAARLGCTSLRLEVDPSNAAAVRLYESAGYRPVRTWPDWYGPGRPAVVYRRAIPHGPRA